LLGEEVVVDGAAMEDLCGPEQAGAGLTVRCTAVNTQTQKGGDFTQVSWEADDRK
jgi:hypothetical protein